MDFKRIEVIFLCSFFCLNIYLLLTYFQGQRIEEPDTAINGMHNIEVRLKEDKITYEKPFSEETGEAYYLSAIPTNFYELDAEQIAGAKIINEVMVNKNVSDKDTVIFSKKELVSEVEDFIKRGKKILYGDEYVSYEALTTEKNSLYCSQEYKNIPFYDNSSALILTFEGDEDRLKVLNYSQTHLSDIEELREKQMMISEHDAIVTLYMNSRLPNNSKISKTQLAYTRIYTVNGKNVYIPVWFVWVETGNSTTPQLEKVNAFSNTVITTSVPDVKKE